MISSNFDHIIYLNYLVLYHNFKFINIKRLIGRKWSLESYYDKNINNLEILKIVTATAEVKYYFGFGGFNKDGLVLEAKKKLYSENQLKREQVFANISVDFKKERNFFVERTLVTLSADLVQFDDQGKEIQTVYKTSKKEVINNKQSQ